MLLCACVSRTFEVVCLYGKSRHHGNPKLWVLYVTQLSLFLFLSLPMLSLLYTIVSREQGRGDVLVCASCVCVISVCLRTLCFMKKCHSGMSRLIDISFILSANRITFTVRWRICAVWDCWCFTPAGALTSGGRSRVVLENSGCKQQPVEFNPFFKLKWHLKQAVDFWWTWKRLTERRMEKMTLIIFSRPPSVQLVCRNMMWSWSCRALTPCVVSA